MSTTRKRQFEEDYDSHSQITRDHKKPRILPFRSSPSSKHNHLFSDSPRTIPNPPTITPADSDNDEPIAAYPSSTPPPTNAFSSQPSSLHFSSSNLNEDQDMSDSPPRQTWTSTTTILSGQRLTPPEPTHLAPNATNPASAGRIPTPIYGHFYIAPLPTGGSDISMDSDADDLISVVNSSPQQRWEMENKRRRRRLPSPISEDDDSVLQSPTTVTGTMFGRMDVGGAGNEEGNRDTVQGLKAGESKAKGVTWKKEEARGSGFGKTTFSMGYRADCEKCRMKVPGHYSHVLRA